MKYAEIIDENVTEYTNEVVYAVLNFLKEQAKKKLLDGSEIIDILGAVKEEIFKNRKAWKL